MKNFGKFVLIIFVVLVLLSIFGGIYRAINPTEDYQSSNIAVIEVSGVITESLSVLDQIQELKDNPQLKALIVRVDSPGGAVGASQEIFLELKKLKKDMPVVVSMGDMAASGGLYVALAGDVVMALPGTLTGSMGVLFQITNLSRLMDKILVDPVTIRSGDLKDAGNPLRPMDPRAKRLFEDLVQDTFRIFKEDVKRERKLTDQSITLLSDGRVVNGEQALKIGLVDSIGTFQDAVKVAGEKGKISGKPKLAFLSRKPKSLMERVLGEAISPVKGLVQMKMKYLSYLWDPAQ